MKNDLKIIPVVLMPLIYLGFIYNSLASTVPLHWNYLGNVDRLGSKNELFLIAALPVILYLLFKLIPKIDPKKRIQAMGKKYETLTNLLTLVVSVLAILIVYLVKNNAVQQSNLILITVSVLYVILGNYAQTIKANYFIGIRTPWTLQSEEVWKATHILGGKLWFGGGLVILLACLLFQQPYTLYFFIGVTVITSVVPMVYSYTLYRKLKETVDC